MYKPSKSARVLLLVMSLLTIAACSPAAPVVNQPGATAATVAEATQPATEAPPPAATDAPAAPAATTATDAAAPGAYIEPPFLSERVAAGTLPPIAERLPEEPFVVGPGVLLQDEYMTWENGQYGGDLNVAATFPTGFVNIAGGATILRSPSQTSKASRPNIVSEFSFSDDYTTFNFKIRKGLKWSNGTPVTTEDVRFTFEDLYMDPDVQRPWPTSLYTQGDPELGPATLKIVDDLAFELTFSKPYGALVADLNSWIPYYDIIFKPSTYLKQFHAKYAKPEELAALLEKNNETSWVNLLQSMDVVHWDIGEARAVGMPVLNAWVLTDATEERRIYERNPYFWHVDSAGRQLPYIDRIVNNIVVDTDAQTNAILGGQVTLASGGEVALNKMPVYQQNAERSGLRIFTTGSFNNPVLLFLNHDYQYEDPESVWQKLISDPEKRFARAVVAAIDTDDINQSVFFGLNGEPFLKNMEHNAELAGQLLDEIGMKDRDSAGNRLGPDGKPFSLRITVPPGSADFAPVSELLKEQLGTVGIRVDIDNVAGALFDQRKAANDIMASMSWNDGPAWASGISEDYLPASKGPWSPMTWLYFTTNGKEGRKPPAYIEEFYKLHTSRKEFPPESPEGQAIYAKMIQWFEENYAFIPTTGKKTTPNVVDARLRNLPNEGAPVELDTYINAEGMWFAN